MAKRADGEGSVYEYPKGSGRWIGEIVLYGKRKRVSGRDKRDAAGKLRKLIRESETTGRAVDGHLSVRTIVEQWLSVELPARARSIAPSTVVRFETHARTIIEELGSSRAQTLSHDRVEQMYRKLATKGTNSAAGGRRKPHTWAYSSLVSLRSAFGQMFAWAVRRGMITRNIIPDTVIPDVAAEPTTGEAMPIEDARALWAACETNTRCGPMWRVQLMTGLRPGEAAGLVWSSVDLDSDVPSITISRAIRLARNGVPQLIDGVKTDGSYRTLALPPDLVPVLREHRARQREERIAATSWADLDLVFATSSGAPLSPSNVRRDLAKLCASIGIDAPTSNELRHTAASMMLDRGMSLEKVADVLGHRTTRMLEKHYRHRLRPVESAHVAAMTGAYA